MAKVLPLYDVLNKKIKELGILHDNVSIDESMVPYRGRHSCKQYIKNKPVKFGFKLWVLASSTGLPYDVRIYEGKGSVDKGTLLGVNVINNALDACATTAGKHVFFDNFFTLIPLIENLKKKQIKATGTIRDDRLMGCPYRIEIHYG